MSNKMSKISKVSNPTRRHILARGAAAAGFLASGARGRGQQSDTIKIGVVSWASGPGAQLGNYVILGAQIAADLINKAGGVAGRKLEVVVKDSQANPNMAAQMARELVGDGTKLVVGPLSTPELLAMLPALEQAGALGITAGSAGMEVTHDNYSRFVFRGTSQAYMECKSLAYFTAERYPNSLSWANIFVDTQATRDGAKMFTYFLREAHAAKGRKAAFIDDMPIAMGAIDLRSQISLLANSPTQGLNDVMFGQAGITFWKQASAFGLQKKFDVVVSRGADANTFKSLRQNLPQTFWVSHFWWPDAYKNVPASVEHYAEFKARTKEDFAPGNYASGANAVMALAAAIKAANGSTEPEALRTVFETELKVPSLRGPVYFRKEDHQLVCPIDAIKVEGSDEEPGFKVADFVSHDGAKMIEPPGPGTPFKL